MWTNIIIGCALGIALGALIIGLWRRHNDLFAVLVVGGVVALAVAVTVYWVDQYRGSQQAAQPAAEAKPTTGSGIAGSGSSMAPARNPSPGMIGRTGAAAPAAAKNPYAGAGG